MKIAFFDSGIGGVTVLAEAIRLFPNEDYLYFADSLYAPYGSRSLREVESLVIDAVDFLASKDVDVLVIACHTASRLMAKTLRRRGYPFEIVEMQSGVGSLSPLNREKRHLICATDLSIDIWKEQLEAKQVEANYVSLQDLVVFAETLNFSSREISTYLAETFAPIDWSRYHSVVLGCTHFPFFKDRIQALLPRGVQILDGSLSTARMLGKFIRETDSPKAKSINYFVSKKPVGSTTLSKCLDLLGRDALGARPKPSLDVDARWKAGWVSQ